MDADQLQQLINAVAQPGRSGKRLTPFSSTNATDWLAWRENFMHVAALKDWTPQQRKLEILAAMEGLACRQVRTIDVDGLTWEQVLDAYGNRFLPPAAGQLAREEFASSKQYDQESITSWHTRIAELYSRAYPNGDVENDTVLIDRFIFGLFHPDVMERTLDVNPNTMTAALATATMKLANVQRAARARGEQHGRHWSDEY